MENSLPIITWFANREYYGKQSSHNHMVCQCILEIMPPSGKEQNRQNHGIMAFLPPKIRPPLYSTLISSQKLENDVVFFCILFFDKHCTPIPLFLHISVLPDWVDWDHSWKHRTCELLKANTSAGMYKCYKEWNSLIFCTKLYLLVLVYVKIKFFSQYVEQNLAKITSVEEPRSWGSAPILPEEVEGSLAEILTNGKIDAPKRMEVARSIGTRYGLALHNSGKFSSFINFLPNLRCLPTTWITQLMGCLRVV